MDFIDPFYAYFINKHGIETFNKIKNIILSKVEDIKPSSREYPSKEEFLKTYVIYVFEIALTDYWGMNNNQVTKYIKITMDEKFVSQLSINRVKMIHKDAIKLIQFYLEQTSNEVGGLINE